MSLLLLFRPSADATPAAVMVGQSGVFLEHSSSTFAEMISAMFREHTSATFEE